VRREVIRNPVATNGIEDAAQVPRSRQQPGTPTPQALITRRKAAGDGGMEALAILKRRLSNVVHRALLVDARQTHSGRIRRATARKGRFAEGPLSTVSGCHCFAEAVALHSGSQQPGPLPARRLPSCSPSLTRPRSRPRSRFGFDPPHPVHQAHPTVRHGQLPGPTELVIQTLRTLPSRPLERQAPQRRTTRRRPLGGVLAKDADADSQWA
jgi:hypothetical protein